MPFGAAPQLEAEGHPAVTRYVQVTRLACSPTTCDAPTTIQRRLVWMVRGSSPWKLC